MATYDNIRIEHADGIARLTVDRPKVLNALNEATLVELKAAVEALPSDTRVLIIAGGGDKAFVAGADIGAMVEFEPLQARKFSRFGHDILLMLERLPCPTIAEVQGYALGGGCELMLACDFAIASDKALIGLPEVTIGVLPGFGGTFRLAQQIGPAAARQMIFTGKPIGAEEALRIGLVNEVVAPEALRERVDAIAASIVKNAPQAIDLAKRSSYMGQDADAANAATYEQEVFSLCFTTSDQKEGMTAFLEKRKPTWQG